MVKLSIIVPVYNTEVYKLQRCFDSIKSLYDIVDNFECLIIDDGSKKKIGDFCEDYVSAYSFFKYIKKNNGGVSSARNLGLKRAEGEFICFVDSDDEIIANDFYNITMDYDICFSDIFVTDGRKKYLWKAFKENQRELTYEEVLERVTKDGKINGPVGKIIRRDFLRKKYVLFREDMILGEDAVFLFDIMKEKPKMFYYADSSYLYYKTNETGRNRLVSNSGLCMINNEIMYNKMIGLTEKVALSNTKKELLILRTTERYIKQIFNIGTDLFNIKQMNEVHKNQLFDMLMKIDYEKQKLLLEKGSKKSKIQFNIILKKKWIYMLIYAWLRNIYLYLKGLN